MTPWERMLLAVGIVYLAFKGASSRRLAPARALGFWALWPGMDARPFALDRPGQGGRLIVWGASRMAVGSTLLLSHLGVPPMDLLRVFVGIGLLIHFGLCDVLAGFWRSRGVPVERLFVNPAASRSLGEFWGRRWNLAFHVVARDRVYRPVARRLGEAWGLGVTFLFSGLLHELLLSVPSGGGYGLPTGYFLLHGLLVLGERRWGSLGTAWTMFWVIVPSPMLFHPWFVKAILLPLA